MITTGTRILIKFIGLLTISFLSPVYAVMEATAKFDYWPSWVRIGTALLAGVISAASTATAFCDTGFGKWLESQKEEPQKQPPTPAPMEDKDAKSIITDTTKGTP